MIVILYQFFNENLLQTHHASLFFWFHAHRKMQSDSIYSSNVCNLPQRPPQFPPLLSLNYCDWDMGICPFCAHPFSGSRMLIFCSLNSLQRCTSTDSEQLQGQHEKWPRLPRLHYTRCPTHPPRKTSSSLTDSGNPQSKEGIREICPPPLVSSAPQHVLSTHRVAERETADRLNRLMGIEDIDHHRKMGFWVSPEGQGEMTWVACTGTYCKTDSRQNGPGTQGTGVSDLCVLGQVAGLSCLLRLVERDGPLLWSLERT